MDVKGIDPLIRRFKDPQVPAKPVRVFYLAAGKKMRTNVQQSVGVRSGRAKKSIRRSGVSKKRMPKVMKVFTRLKHLRLMEYGTQHVEARRWFLDGLHKSTGDIRRGLQTLERELLHALQGKR